MTTVPGAHHPIAEPDDVAMQFDSTVGVDPVPGTHTLIDRVLEVLAASALTAITLILFANAVLRFAFNAPLGWTEELVTGLMLWLTMLGFTLGVRRRESISIRAFVGRLSIRNQVWLRLATDLLTAAVLLHLAWFAYLYVTKFGDDPVPYLRLPSGFFTAALPIGALAAALIVLFQLPGCRAAILRQIDEEKE
ncbi:TRAP transporter small permease [Mycobacterium sp. ITM-2016-00317]|uniref:TRAP transporter small permease n=1 Tax=Mycobacterium sp. ITM-2016-00317 TaxID=2099694 RepID=UPI000D4C2DAA|nr:TRAP transporter small permease [Mycobacterium sp. ITM-2016-00317]WNG90169.1 TRAP transporter small permease [Mycobacterium sp. ITM-2016-00317]